MTYKAGIIGTGLIGKRHADAHQNHDDLELITVADLDQEQLDQFGKQWSIEPSKRYLKYAEMIEAEDLDIVSICTPTHLHATHTIDVACIADDLEVIWCEKPIATSVNDAQKMVDTCNNSNVDLVINHTLRFLDDVTQLRRMIQDDQILGEVFTVNIQWMRELLRLGTHAVDLLVYLLDEDGDHVISGHLTGQNGVANKAEMASSSMEELDDVSGAGMFRLSSGTLVMLECTSPRATPREVIDFLGSNGRLALDYPNEELRYWRFDGDDVLEESLPEIDWVNVEDKIFHNAAKNIVDIIEGTAKNRSPGSDAMKSLEILIGVFIASYTSGSVSLPLEPALRSVNITSW